MTTATEKQVRYIMYLLGRAGYSTRYMDSAFKALGASMRQRSGSVEDWVRNLSISEASQLIDRLRQQAETGE
ncbi:MAG: hypothetical protein NZM12_01470 [Steroidobacteraceae bacterium]|nr:hypothetical protein [Steroidobacteraceae bacterium]MDW8260844.1 hypothetical protein [Gammaproteobacteria bacterium]